MVWILVLLAIVAAVAVGFVAWSRSRRQATETASSDELRQLFGPEYDRAVVEYGDRNTAEDDLRARLHQARTLSLTPLTAEQHDAFAAQWNAIQARVVQAPTRAVVDAEGLFEEMLLARGYPRSTGERMTTISVREPHLLDDYRHAHSVAVSALDQRANTEACRQALLRYRRLFETVLAAQPVERERLDLRDRARAAADERDHVTS